MVDHLYPSNQVARGGPHEHQLREVSRVRGQEEVSGRGGCICIRYNIIIFNWSE